MKTDNGRFQFRIERFEFADGAEGVPADSMLAALFQVLSNPRACARFPFYILMNTEDRLVQFKATRECHPRLRLSNCRGKARSGLDHH